jgi:signal transduction histidine kinase
MKEKKKYKYGLAVKITSVALLLVFLLTAAGSMLGIYYMVEDGYYRNNFSFYESELCEDVTRDYANEVFYEYLPLSRKSFHTLTAEETFKLEQFQRELSSSNTNFLFTIKDEYQQIFLSNFENQKCGLQISYAYEVTSGSVRKFYTVDCYVRDPISADDQYMQPLQIYNMLYSARYNLIALAAISCVIIIVLFVFLMCSAGRKKNSSEITATWHHKIPFELMTAGLLLIGVLAAKVFSSVSWSWNGYYGFLSAVPISIILITFFSLALAFLMNFAVRVKLGRWWENTVVYRLLRLVIKVLRSIFKAVCFLFGKLPMIWKAALMIAGYLFMNMLIAAAVVAIEAATAVLAWVVFNFTAFAALCFLLLHMKKLKSAGEKIVSGDYSGVIDTKHMLWDIKEHAEHLNNIGAGMSRAVEERLKSERLKTELITNVSHDIKTPLTSIVNYIDLLKKEPVENETVAGYIDVLDRQSARLKKLTEDLLEASKASTGNLSVSFTKIDMNELIRQSMGEYAERFEKNQLTMVFQTNQEQAFVCADGRLLWRVFDNLLNNIFKYSQPHTRVYINVDTVDSRTKITLMNISKYALNITPDELMERFVRGDTSRTTDGSGLGLSIANSLVELQKGSFALSVEGDLFKAVITFHSIQP